METWREKKGGIVLMENVSAFENEKDGDEVEPRREHVGIEVCGDEDWVVSVVEVIAGSPSEADGAEGVVDTAF